MTIFGSEGDTGLHRLTESLTTDSLWCPGQTDSFLVEAVDLGTLQRVVLDHDDPG